MATDGPYRLVVLSADHADAVFALRCRAFESARELRWKNAARLRWNDDDEAGLSLGILDNDGKLLTSTRVLLKNTRQSAEQYLEYSLAHLPARYPSLITGRATTDPAYRKHGLLALMRQRYLEILSQWHSNGWPTGVRPVVSLLGVVYEQAPRVQSLLDMGYQPFACTHYWDSEAQPLRKPILISMPSNEFARAAQFSEPVTQSIARQTHYDPAYLRSALQRALS